MRTRHEQSGWIAGLPGKLRKGWRHEETDNLISSFPFLFCSGGLIPRALRTAHAEGGGSPLLWRRPRDEVGFLFPLCYWRSCMAGLHIP